MTSGGPFRPKTFYESVSLRWQRVREGSERMAKATSWLKSLVAWEE